ncbi:MAG: hypothetical protein IKC21_03550 [Ruminococcus sp.]|jgi:hypothetical protein|nr:hypothetical protein [Ruminococcus sp.]
MAKKRKNENELDRAYRDLLEYNDRREKNRSDLLQFFVGLLMLAAGVFMIFQNLNIESTWGYGGYLFSFGGFNLPNGTIFVPLFIGIVMLFLMDRKFFGWLFIAVGLVIILAAVLMSVRMHWRTTNAYMFVLMFGLTAAGGGLVLRQLFKK